MGWHVALTPHVFRELQRATRARFARTRISSFSDWLTLLLMNIAVDDRALFAGRRAGLCVRYPRMSMTFRVNGGPHDLTLDPRIVFSTQSAIT